VGHAVVAALLEGAEQPGAGEGLLDGGQHVVPVVGVAGVRLVAAGAGEAVEILAVGAGAKAYLGGAGHRLVELRLEPGLERLVDGGQQHVGAELVQGALADRCVGVERGVGQERVDALVEAVLPHELIVIEEGDAEGLAHRDPGRARQHRVLGRLAAEGQHRLLDGVAQRGARGRLGGDVLDVEQLGDREVHGGQGHRRGPVGSPEALGVGL